LKEKQPTKQKSVKNKQILINRISKTINPQVLKKCATPQKKQVQIRGRTGNTGCLADIY